MLLGPLEQGRQKRTHAKVRTGCATCKSRRVKCDENKPSCGRCKIGNRKCVYAIPKQWLFDPVTEHAILKPLSPITLGDSDEQRAFDFFRQNTAAQFAGQHELAQRFWNQFIPQSALNHTLIYQMAVAMGSRHEATAFGSNTADELATKRHAIVMSSMARNLHSMNVDTSLLCCCMLMGYANLCEEVPATAAIHFSLGLKILRERGKDPTIITDSMCAFIEPMFSELELATVLFAVPADNVTIMGTARPSVPAVPSHFNDLHEAKQTLADILSWRLYVMIEHRDTSNLHLTFAGIDELLASWRQKVLQYSLLIAATHPGLYLKARKMLFQYKLFGMCKGAASNSVFVDACRVRVLSVDFSQPHIASILCTYFKNDDVDNNWQPLAPKPTRRLDEDDLDIWPQGEHVGHDGSNQIVRIVLGR